jgi:hypothetical protein
LTRVKLILAFNRDSETFEVTIASQGKCAHIGQLHVNTVLTVHALQTNTSTR